MGKISWALKRLYLLLHKATAKSVNWFHQKLLLHNFWSNKITDLTGGHAEK